MDSRVHLINLWTDPEPGPAAFSPMPPSMVWLPLEHAPGQYCTACVYVGGWADYPYASTALQLGPRFAAAGVIFLSLGLRRRGMEGSLQATSDWDLRDIKLALDWLATRGPGPVYLLGEGIGGTSILRYIARVGDQRVRGFVWLEPQSQPDEWLQSAVGAARYREALRTAGVAARQGAGMDMRIELPLPGSAPLVQNAGPFLSWWASQGDLNLKRNLADCRVPLLGISTVSADALAALTAAPADGRELRNVSAEDCAEVLLDWIQQRDSLATPATQAPLLLQAESGGRSLVGLLWTPPDDRHVNTVVVLVPGLTSSPLSPLFGKLAPVLAARGVAVMATELRRSGWAGHESALLDYDSEDIKVWLDRLEAEGYSRIVLAGASLGSISIGRYQSLQQDPRVVGLAHLMPTAECPDWFCAAAGNGHYAAAVACARAALAAGEGATVLIDVDVRQPPPSRYGGRFRWTQRAAGWLSWWGPDADSRNLRHIAGARVPVLLLSGTEDSYNTPERFAELRAAAVNAPSVDEVWYPDVDHGLAGVEAQAAQDLYAWMQSRNLL